MADENTPAFYPRVGRNIAKNFRSAQPPAFIEDPRAMDLPQYGDVDLSQPTKSNLEMGRRMAERDAQLKRQQSADTSPLEKAAGALQSVRLMGSALTQAINSMPTRIAKGDKAAEQFMQERMYQPTQPTAYEYAGDIGDFLERLETEYKLPPILPEAVALQYLTGPATSQAMRTAGKGAQALEQRMAPAVTQALDRGGLQRDLLLGLGQGTQSNVVKPKGGVSISSNPDTMMMELGNKKAKPPKIPTPIKFPVTRGPSIPEIRAMAERMAPQVMGEFVRAAPTPSKPNPSESVVGKSRKQFEREKTLPIEYENIKDPVTPEEFDYAKKKGALLIGAQGDVTPGNRMLVSIDEQPLSTPVHLQAGPEWELYNPSAWAATDQMAKTWMKRAKKASEEYEADPYLHYHKMTPDANWYAMHHFNSVLGHLRPEELKLRDPKLYQQMLEEIRTKDVGFGKHPEFEGFDDPLNLQIHAQMDPNFRRHIGAIFGGPKFTQRYGLNSGQDVLAATSLPELRDLEAGAGGYAVVPLDVNAPLKHFEADSQTYDTGFPKAGASGRSKYPMPYQLMYRDTLNWMKDVPSENKSSEFGRMNMIVPKQQIDDELINAIGEYQRRMKELTGKKRGGAVQKAEGGEVSGDDLILEERPL